MVGYACESLVFPRERPSVEAENDRTPGCFNQSPRLVKAVLEDRRGMWFFGDVLPTASKGRFRQAALRTVFEFVKAPAAGILFEDQALKRKRPRKRKRRDPEDSVSWRGHGSRRDNSPAALGSPC